MSNYIALLFDHETNYINYESGRFIRKSKQSELVWEGSDQWICTGAVRFNNFGRIVETVSRYALVQIIQRGEFYYKNGKQRWHITDIDHGTHRIQMNPAPKFVRITSME
jgi:hypothetical protein